MFLTTIRHRYFFEKYTSMKKSLFIIFTGLTLTAAHAQGLTDALQYAQPNLTGTARFQAMSGAFGALGGDLSSINANPASSSVFAGTQVGGTMSLNNFRNKSDYFGNKNSENFTNFDLNQVGGVLVFNNNFSETSKWRKFAIALAYEDSNNFDDRQYTSGTNPTSSATGYFASVANSIQVPVNFLEDYNYTELSLREQIAYMGYQGYLINFNPANPANNRYVANVTPGTFYQENYVQSSGSNGKVAFNMSAEYNQRFYFGLNLNTHFTDLCRVTNFYEQGNSTTPDGVKSFYFDRGLHTYGNGFSFQLGAIAKITQSFRAGLVYESPTWYTLTDELIQNVYTDSGYNFGNPPNPNLTSAPPVDSNYLIVYDRYKLKTPGKWTGSLAYIFGKYGLLSIDYSLKDYSATKFRPNDSFFDPVNRSIDNNLAVAGALCIGGEWRIKQWSLRGGFRNEESPYKDKKIMGDLTGFSGGFGYNFGKTKIDLSYSNAQRTTRQSLFSEGFTGTPKVKSQSNNVALTLLFDI